MPPQIVLDDSSYEDIYGRAIELLDDRAPWWTHREVSDPGIMLLEMWALLTDMQSYYLDQIQESHYRKYLKLLGVRLDEGECARSWVFFEKVRGEYVVPVGTKLLADRMVFETEEEVRLIGNRLTGFYVGDGQNRIAAMKLRRKSSFLLREGEEALFSFTLEEAVEQGEDFLFYILLREKGKRNPVEGDFHLADLTWEYSTEEGFGEAQILRDDTRGLLTSGLICLRTDRPMGRAGGRGFEFRCRIREGGYDAFPILYKIYLHVIPVIQRDTICLTEDVEFSGDCHRVALRSYLARTGSLWLLRRIDAPTAERQRELWEDITDSPQVCVDPPITAKCRERYITYAGEGTVRVVCQADNVGLEELDRRITGIAAQRIPLPWEGVLRSEVGLMLRHGTGELYRSYLCEEPEENRYGNAWHFDEKENVIILGDGRHGDIPPPSEDGLRFTSLALWDGEKGNVAVGRINAWMRPELFPEFTGVNFLSGKGGRGRRLPSQQFREIEDKLFDQKRMVTTSDIRSLALRTPGLMLEDAQVQWGEWELVVKLVPKYALKSRECVERYRRQAEKYLEPFRLAGTCLRIELEEG
ncbi:MAG: hypothetical protein NC543_10090 [bacterium]|nr:hypothetical protein [bacterium]MCM1374334.1 hypothetical protein [Muribaculum sp.]